MCLHMMKVRRHIMDVEDVEDAENVEDAEDAEDAEEVEVVENASDFDMSDNMTFEETVSQIMEYCRSAIEKSTDSCVVKFTNELNVMDKIHVPRNSYRAFHDVRDKLNEDRSLFVKFVMMELRGKYFMNMEFRIEILR